MTEQILATAAETVVPVAAEAVVPVAEAVAPALTPALAKAALPKLGKGEIAMLTFAGIGVLATGYFVFIGGKWVFKKIKSSAEAKKAAQTAQEQPKAEESTEEK